MKYGPDVLQSAERAFETEWLLPDGRGGYASGTLAGAATRRYHGLWVANLAGRGRTRLVKTLDIEWRSAGGTHELSTQAYVDVVHPQGFRLASEAEVTSDRFVLRWRVGDAEIERTIRFDAEGVVVEFRLVSGQEGTLVVRPIVTAVDHHELRHDPAPVGLTFPPDGFVATVYGVGVRCEAPGWQIAPEGHWYVRYHHERERERGLDSEGMGYYPARLTAVLAPGATLALRFRGEGASPPLARRTREGETVADRLAEAADRCAIESPEGPGILAGYPWFTDWGRDTMIALPGVALARRDADWGRRVVARYLSTVREGLIPNRFHEGGGGTDRNTVDATLWMFEAIARLHQISPDEEFLADALPTLREIVDAHLAGTLYGIRCEPDGLLTQGGPGLQLTWMDAKIGDWVVTPRTGKAIEINGLWHNALRLYAGWAADERAADAADRCADAMRRFVDGAIFDVLDPDDARLRPNAILALSLVHSPFDPADARRIVDETEAALWTPCGLRTLAPDDPAYRGRFEGDMLSRDSAYHQGTAWPWLFGPFARAAKRAGRTEAVRRTVRAVRGLLDRPGIFGVSEVYDGDAPQRPGGCPWQAWSAAELYRTWRELGPGSGEEVAASPGAGTSE